MTRQIFSCGEQHHQLEKQSTADCWLVPGNRSKRRDDHSCRPLLIDGKSDKPQTADVDRHRRREDHESCRGLSQSGRRGDRLIQLTEHTVMPGLMDMHTHLMSQHSKDSYTERFFMDQADYALRSTVYARAHADGRLHDGARPGRQRRQFDRAAEGDRPGLGSRSANLHVRQVAGDDRRPCRSDECAARRLPPRPGPAGRRHQRRRRRPQGGAAALQGRRRPDQAHRDRRRAQPGGQRAESRSSPTRSCRPSSPRPRTTT